MAGKNVLNGVDVEQLSETIDLIKDKADVAKFRFRAKNHWVDGAHNQTLIESFYGACENHRHEEPFIFDEDEPPALLGKDRGANPVEFILTALAGCLTTSLIYHAAVRGIKIEEVRSELEGELDLHGFLGLSELIRNGYDQVKVKFWIKADAPDEKIAELIELAQQRSPVFDIVSNPVPVKVEFEML